ncbi:unknown [Antheraea pernyi nucleopolyhedrovirus]|uniref:Uncharacterized protein n=2 Tax=Antheraea pernyi nuclear polyhedrosis virus TaxID=161494 RepID=Q1HH56_NPVAP|nr:hypothetical protein APNV_p041 [Antheraea pernyi nucleopolyhedrovirus]BBD50494.1 hypothetical protein [Antheraea yamamai nucleopolyhedrovirus]BBD50646.1 hypothetical protein [Samia cynthia nucleopolyhedrovirus]BBD50798.1 hypothetical protein [Antheraea proylei nucleopolyhedrovirus]ABF50279.2 unknown [Antheraea pernyi nucleopolyhedrovirus]ABQ12268.1 unknown [Antheraea pernyi nucleopolyhedrovirus]
MFLTASVLYVPDAYVSLTQYFVVTQVTCCTGERLALVLVDKPIIDDRLKVLESADYTPHNIELLWYKIGEIADSYNKYCST